MDAGTGFEPVWTESKSAILPLDDPAIAGRTLEIEPRYEIGKG